MASPHLNPFYRSASPGASLLPAWLRGLLQHRSRRLHVLEWVSEIVNATSAVLFFLPRVRAYRNLLRYDPRQGCVSGLGGPSIEIVPVALRHRAFVLPHLKSGTVSGLLELDLQASFAGRVLDPYVELTANELFRDRQFLERGVGGTRYLNITRLLASGIQPGDTVRLRGRHLAFRGSRARLLLSSEAISAADRVLVVSAHPDDAEIAAFGVYADTGATVVTLTAGDASDLYDSSASARMGLPRASIAKMRVWDSITVPQFGDVAPEKALNLCFPDGRLKDMCAQPDRVFLHEGLTSRAFARLRRLNLSSLLRQDQVCSWNGLLADLVGILTQVQPSVIVAPHPWLDPHPDHIFATIAIAQAMAALGQTTSRLFCYCVHNVRSELWPFGPAGTGVAALPIFTEDAIQPSGFYSHSLNENMQRNKFLALEAMHDVREMTWPETGHAGIAVRRAWTRAKGVAHGMGRLPTSYIRRALRPDETFFVIPAANVLQFASQCLQRATQQ